MDTPGILLRLEDIDNLPSLPIIVQQIQKLIASPNSSMAQIGALIARDQAITARVVRLVNSAFYGFSTRISSIPQAIMLLGLNTVKNLVTAVSVVKMFAAEGNTELFDRQKYWLHSFSCAMGARMLAKSLGRREPEDYFLAGLLHDVGVLVLDQFFHEEFTSVLKHATENRLDYYSAEKAVLDTTHGHIGEAVAEKWHVPVFLGHVMRRHHDPLITEEGMKSSSDIIALVHIADVAANNNGMHIGFFTGQREFCKHALDSTNIRQGVINEVFAVVEKEVKTLAAEWGL